MKNTVFAVALFLSTAVFAGTSAKDLRTQLLECAEKLGGLKTSDTLAVFKMSPSPTELGLKPYLFLFNENGSFVVPMTKEEMKDGRFQVLVTMPGAKNQVMVTGSYQAEDMSDMSLLVRNQNPELPTDTVKVKKEAILTDKTESHFVDNILLPEVSERIIEGYHTAASQFPMSHIKDNAVYQAAHKKAASIVEDDPAKAVQIVKEGYKNAFTLITKEAIEKTSSNLAESMNALKVCAQIENAAIQKGSTKRLVDLGKMKIVGDQIKNTVVVTVNENYDKKVLPNIEHMSDINEVQAKSALFASTFFLDLRKSVMDSWEQNSQHTKPVPTRSLASH